MNATCPDAVEKCEEESVEYYGYLYCNTTIGIIGIIFNCCNLGLLTSATFKGCGPTFLFLTAIAAADLLCLCLVCPLGITQCAVLDENKHFYAKQVYEIYVFLPIANSFATASVWLTTIVAIERFITITQLSLAKKICTKFYAKWAICMIFAVAFVIHIPFFFYRRISHTSHKKFTSFARSEGFLIYTWIRIVVVKYLPIIIVAIFNLLLLVNVCKAYQRRKHIAKYIPKETAEHQQQQQNKCTAMLLGVTVTFFLCHSFEPFAHPIFFRSMFGLCSIFSHTYRNLVMCINILESFSYGSNFIFYCAFNKEFSTKLKSILKCKCFSKI